MSCRNSLVVVRRDRRSAVGALRRPFPLHLQPAHQPTGVGVEGVGDAEDVVEAEVALAAFDLADVRPVQGGALGQLLLRQAQLLAAGAHTPAKLTSGW